MKKQEFKFLLFLFLGTLLFQACKKDNIEPTPDENSSLSEAPEGYFESEFNANGFSDRITYSNNVILWENLNPFSAGEEDRTGDDCSDMFWLHVADVETYTLQGETLSATHIDFHDNKAYVSYHKRGATHMGAVEIIDLSDPTAPSIIFNGHTTEADINAITVGDDSNGQDVNVWLAMSDHNKGGVLAELRMAGGTTYDGFSIVNLSKHIESGITSSANAVSHSGDYLYVMSGKSHGGAFCLNTEDLNVLGSVEFQNGKSIDVNGHNGSASKVVSLQAGDQSSIRVEDIGSFHFSDEFEIGTILHQNVDATSSGKSALHFVDNNPDEVYVTMGMEGLKRFNIYTGEETWQSPSDMISSGNTNGVTSDGEFIYVANGADGLTVFTQPEIGEDPERVFQWDLDDAQTASANMVATYGEWVFVAKGQGGVKILKRPQPGDYLPIDSYDDLGTPENMAEDEVICSTLLPNIFSNFLPEGQNTVATHPEFFNDDVPSSILIEEDAELAVTFVFEGAGYKNVLGYYYYDADNPPASVEEIQKLIIFPNASAEGSGGGLIEGNTVVLLGNFKANTVLGFFLNSNGWSNGEITEGLGAHYTDFNWNTNNSRQSILMYDNTCGATVIGFEDIYVPNSDKDFNDAIFQINCTPASAIDVGRFIQL